MELREMLISGPLNKLGGQVDPYLEASMISRSDQGTAWIAPAKGHKGFRLAGNVLSRRERIAKVLGTDARGMTEVMLKAMEDPLPPRKVERPGHYREIDVDSLPIPTYFRDDGGPYITSGIFHATYGKASNLSFHRMMSLGAGRFAVRVVPRHLYALIKAAEESGERLRATVSIGADPASLIAASTSLAFGCDETGVASRLTKMASGEPLEVFQPAKGWPEAPMGAEIVLTGTFTGESAPEGPFVDITSTYDDSGLVPGEPVFKVDSVLARKDPIVHVLVPGGWEHYQLMGIPKEPSILQSVRKVVPDVRAVRLTEGGCCWLHGLVSIRKQKEGDGKNAIMAAFTGHPSMKKVVVVDEDVDIFDDVQVEWALATRFQGGRDLVLVENARGSTLDPSADPEDGTTSKLGMDATVPISRRDTFKKVLT